MNTGVETDLSQSQNDHSDWTSTAIDNIWHQIRGGQVALYRCAIALSLLAPFLILAYHFDTRTVLEVNPWVKPIKFTVSLFFYAITLSWFCNYLPHKWRDNKFFNRFTTLVILCIALEILWLIYSAFTGEISHFNRTHPILSTIYPLMGIVAVLLTTQSFVVGIGVWRNTHLALHHLIRNTLALGLITTFILTLITAGYMSSGVGHKVPPVGVSGSSESETVIFIGWLRAAGDLRVAHFFATHAMHLIPFIGFLLARTFFINTYPPRDRNIAILITAAYAMYVAFVFIQALTGRAFIAY